MSKRKYYSDELAEAVKAMYDGSSEVITQLQTEFNVPRYTVLATARRFGVSRKRQKNWTHEEEGQLRELWGVKTIPQIIKIMGRSKNAIIVKSKRLGLDGITKAEMITANAAANLLNIDRHTILDRWIPKYGLKARHIAMKGVKKMWMIKHTDLMKWLRDNQDKWDSRRVELYALGLEQKWLKEKRKRDSQNTLKTGQKWTPEEDARAIMLFKAGMNYAKIGEQMQRSGCGVEHRLNRLDVWGTGKYVGDRKYKTSGKFAKMKELADRKRLITRFAELLLIKRNQIAFDGFWQKSMCMNWNDVRGCLAAQSNCDDCTEFIRIREQYCRRCGIVFYKRKITDMCDSCKVTRKKQYQKKWVIIHKNRRVKTG